MSVSVLKTIMHQRIEQLQDEETVLDLFATMSSFLDSRSVPPDSSSPEIVARLQKALANRKRGNRASTRMNWSPKCSNGVSNHTSIRPTL